MPASLGRCPIARSSPPPRTSWLAAFLVVPTDRRSRDGEPVNALFAVARAIHRVIAFKVPARAVAVVSADAAAWPALVKQQRTQLPALLTALGLHVVETDDEASLVASYVRAALDAGDDAIIVGVDKRYGMFHNTAVTPVGVQGGFLPMFGELLFGGQERRPPAPLPLERPHALWAQRPDTGFRVTWLGHSTVLLELDGRRILTDPVFGKRVSPIGFIGPKRFHPVPAELAELPPLDLILLSHDHFDHLCKPTMTALARGNVPIVTALGVGAHLERYGFAPERITELDWHESIELGGLRLTATPAQHFSGRAVGGRNKTLWASWVIQSERRKVFFSGDTGLTPEFEAIGRAHGPFDLVMLEIGAYHPAWGTIHLGPENALEAFRMLGGGTLLPVHWGTFSLGFHAWNDPGETLVELAGQRGARILTPRLGAAFEPEQVDGPSPWWREVLSRRERARLEPVLE